MKRLWLVVENLLHRIRERRIGRAFGDDGMFCAHLDHWHSSHSLTK